MGSCISQNPKDQEDCELITRSQAGNASADEVPRDRPIKLMCWNIQFCAGRNHLFFYEGGQAVVVPIEDVEQTMQVVADIIADNAPDIVLLQEVDRNSKRTHFQDELHGILERLDRAGHSYPYVASAPYHRVCYVPAPGHEHMGRVDLNLVTLSKFRIERGTRHQLPLLNESWMRQMFNLKRAVMDIEMPIAGGGKFVALNTHLSAFAFNDGTPEREIAELSKHAARLERQASPWYMLPPGDDPGRLGVINNEDHSQYYNPESPVKPLTDEHRSAMDLEAHARNPEPFRTYVPLGTDTPDRVLDWMFTGTKTQILKYSVLSKHRHISIASDHLPLLLEFKI
eukprot:CAMPEP_0171214968 /NCGR_PEP_ID=MMETSP0790-20130122/31427_1 /TAXON_ID=2925 /ORGANISM="Alexandrium catenella, Strain OF101" /LENGTH=340 /DNA_ID=CAMNT_0011680711 /DNA_START=66 /DNA_END=1088 /DNA_ORIENTATION=-